jgi:hypothetical protein
MLPPTLKINVIRYHMLNDFTNAIWRERNSIAHNATNLNDMAQELTIDLCLSWHRLHFFYNSILSDFYLINEIQEERLISAPLCTKCQWLRHLDATRDVYAVECSVWERGQSCITDFFLPTH